jgi:uncharacterized membrane protein HdeD (DUF308 family)
MVYTLQVMMDKQSRKTVMTVSIILLLLGVIGIVLPQFMSMAIAWFIGWLLLAAGIKLLLITWYGFRDRWIVWLKPFVLIIIGLLILFNPIAGAAALGLMLGIYFLLDGFAGVAFAWELRPSSGWGWLMLNGLMSLALAAIFILGWPFTTAWLVGLLVGISLFIDGLTLLMLGLAAKSH